MVSRYLWHWKLSKRAVKLIPIGQAQPDNLPPPLRPPWLWPNWRRCPRGASIGASCVSPTCSLWSIKYLIQTFYGSNWPIVLWYYDIIVMVSRAGEQETVVSMIALHRSLLAALQPHLHHSYNCLALTISTWSFFLRFDNWHWCPTLNILNRKETF